jgi:uncharacterized protein
MSAVRRRTLLRTLASAPIAAAGLAAAGLAGLSACTSSSPDRRWHLGRLTIGTGNPTGVFYQVGGGYADVITRHIRGYEAIAAPTGGAADNLLRLSRDDVQIALTFTDVAADAYGGQGTFAGSPVAMLAIARIYDGYMHLVARNEAKIHTVADLRGKRVSTGTHNSGTEFMAMRMLTAAGLDPDKDLERLRLSLGDTTTALAAGTIDALFFGGGLPTIGITSLLATSGGAVSFVPTAYLLPEMAKRYGAAYGSAVIDRGVYGLPASVPTLSVGNMIVVDRDMPDALAFDLVRVIFTYQSDLIAVHPEWGNVTADGAKHTDPVPLHPGAESYFNQR